MKKRAICVLLTLCILLSGCSSMLNREYASVTPHSATPAADGDPSVLRVERYQELVNALVYLRAAVCAFIWSLTPWSRVWRTPA